MTQILDAQRKPIQKHKFYRHKAKQNIIFVEDNIPGLEDTWFGTNSYHPKLDVLGKNISIQADWFKNYTLIQHPEKYIHAGQDKEEVESFIKSKEEEISKKEPLKVFGGWIPKKQLGPYLEHQKTVLTGGKNNF